VWEYAVGREFASLGNGSKDVRNRATATADPSGMTTKERAEDKGAAKARAEVEVEKRISPLRGSQMREPLRSK
jgi:hypothetical protein